MADVDGTEANLDNGTVYAGDAQKKTAEADLDKGTVYSWDSGASLETIREFPMIPKVIK